MLVRSEGRLLPAETATVFDADAWTPILTNGNGIWSIGARKKMLAAAELPGGHGSNIAARLNLPV